MLNVNLNTIYKEVEDSFSWWPKHWKITNFVGSKILIKDRKVLHNFHFNFISLLFGYNFLLYQNSWHTTSISSGKWTVLGQKKSNFFFAVTKSFIVIKILHILEFFYNSRTNSWNKKFHEKKKMKKKKKLKI